MSRPSPSVDRVVAVLNFVADHPGASFTFSDIIRALHLSRATCHATLASLANAGYLFRNADKTYTLGPALAALGRKAAAQFSPMRIAQPVMRALSDEFDVVCSALQFDGAAVTIIERTASVSHIGRSAPVGTKIRLRPASGALFLAWSGEEEAGKWLRKVIPAPTDEQRQSLRESLALVRRQGFLVLVRNPDFLPTRSQEETLGTEAFEAPIIMTAQLADGETYGVASILAPVMDSDNNVLFALGMMGFNREMTGKEVTAIAERLRTACATIANQIDPVQEV